MTLINIYLQETPLTSTKNKFLQDDLDSKISIENRPFWKKLKTSLLSPKASTENILLNCKFLKLQDHGLKKKKKGRKILKTTKESLRSMRRSAPPPSLSYNHSDLKKRKRKKRITERSKEAFRSVSRSHGESEEEMGYLCAYEGSEGSRSEACYEACEPSYSEQHGLRGELQDSVDFSQSQAKTFAHCSSQLEVKCCSVGFGASAPSYCPTSPWAPRKIRTVLKMPTYELDIIKLQEESENEFPSAISDDSSILYENSFANFKRKKAQLLNVVNMALMFSSNLKDETDNYRCILQRSLDEIRLIDPEFILKLALYSRQELQIRTVTNFLLSYAAVHQSTCVYLEKYFEHAIVLPTDWLQVAEYFQILSVRRPYPAILRRCMKKCFPKFDKYQLAKYNKNMTKKKKVLLSENDVIENETDDEQLKTINVKFFTLKSLIRTFHIDSPSEHVMCLLGKKYPKSAEEFKSSGLPGVWDPTKAGTRMKLPIPETWETQLSAHGNIPSVWESLIDNQKLPYMAMLRNLRNLILSGISPSHHKKIIDYLQNKKSVINSRQLPMQFFEAYKVITKLQNMLEKENLSSKTSFSEKTPFWKRAQLKKMKEKIQKASAPLLQQYKSAISKALEISSLSNLNPIPGKTLVICQIDTDEDKCMAKIKHYETCIMMGLMCLKACEDCTMTIISKSEVEEKITLNEEDQFFDVLIRTCEKYEEVYAMDCSEDNNTCISSLKSILDYYLKPHIALSQKLDHVVLLQTSSGLEAIISSFLHKYRQIVNSNLLYTNVNFSLSSKSFSEDCASDKDVYLCGSSSSFIKFIAKRSDGGQLTFVENIDMKYDLPEISLSKYNCNVKSLDDSMSVDVCSKDTAVPINYRMPKWRSLRIFISSTFKDMISERDLLIRYVFPELKRRAASIFVRIVEIDLRWGITEADSASKRAAELCVIEAQKSDLFIGLLGERYGTIYNFELPDATDLQWMKDCPNGLSITELEVYAAALRSPQSLQNKAFFYFRDNTFLRDVPTNWNNYFTSEDAECKKKIDTLKDKIRSKIFKVLDGYPCHFAGIFENKPVLGGLDDLGNRVLKDLWDAIQEIHQTDPYSDSLSEEEIFQQNCIESKSFFVEQKNLRLENIINIVKSKQGVFVICGDAGSGKTTLLIHLLPHLKEYVVIKFFIGASPRSRDLSYMLKYICRCICHQLNISITLPDSPIDIVNRFPDFLVEAATCSGDKEIILLIDGLDHLEKRDQTLDWLPLCLPNKFKLLCSTCESSMSYNNLYSRQINGEAIFFQQLPPMLQSEREQCVRNYLSYYRKTLDESAFNNNMLQIVTKKDSSNPFYLQISCDFLRIYASFENLSWMVQKLPSSIILLFQEVIIQMENEFGSTLVQAILTLLCITKEGLEDIDLHYILSFVMHMNEMKTTFIFDELKEKIKSLQPENLVCQVKYCSLMHIISTFAYGQQRQKSFSLVGTEFEKAVEKYYLNKNFVSQSINMHCVLAGYYHYMSDVRSDGKYCGKSGIAMRSLMYHLLNGHLYKILSDMLCNHKFLEAVFRTNADDHLLECYSLLLYDILPKNQKTTKDINHFNLFSFYDFISRNFHILQRYPQLVMQQALNEPSCSIVNLKHDECNYCMLENVSRATLMDYRLATLGGFVKNITASAGAKFMPFVVLGSEDGYLKTLDLSSRMVVHSVKGHVSAITCICFFGKNRICVSSVDGTLSLWNCDDFTRISILSGHKHSVTSCCSDPSGSILFSAGWDNSVRLWSSSDGRSLSVITDFRCPVNCITHHPMKEIIACGLWNGNVEVWDTVSIERKLVMSHAKGSVKSLAYTPDGVNIISSYALSEICIWSSEEGLKIASLQGHILPVKTLTYSLDESIFISGGDDCALKVWSPMHGSHFTTITDSKFCPVSLMEFMSENFLAIAFQNSEVWVVDINSGNVISKFTLEPSIISVFSKYSLVNVIPESPENNLSEKSLLFGTQDGKLMNRNLSSSSISTVTEMDSKITALIHNCEIILCGTSEGEMGVFSHSENQLSKRICDAHKGFIGTLSFTVQCGKLFALSTGNDNVLKLWNIDLDDFDVTLQQIFYNKHRDGITFSLFYPPSTDSSEIHNLFTGSHDNNIISWNFDSVKVLQGLQSSVVNITCNNGYVLGCGNDGAAVMWSPNGTVLTSVPKLEQSSTNLTFYAAEDFSDFFTLILAYVDQDGTIKINKPLQQKYSCSLDGHNKPITSCCTTEKGEVVSCSLDGTVNLWKVPADIDNRHSIHSSVVTGLISSVSLQFALSSDAHGDIVLWKLNLESSASPLSYAGKKSYKGGFIRALSWHNDESFICALNQIIADKEKNFINVIHLTCDSEESMASFQVQKSYDFESEVLCLDSCSKTGIIIVGLKSGHVMCITPEAERLLKICDDWPLKACLFSREKTSDILCISFIDGSIKLYSTDLFMDEKYESPDLFGEYKPTHNYQGSKFTTSMCTGPDKLVCCGDSEGILRIYSRHSLKFIKKVHDDSISGICVSGSHFFTSSLDKTVKGWNLKSFEQVCQFHSHAPISCLSLQTSTMSFVPESYTLFIGTAFGDVHLLKFHSK